MVDPSRPKETAGGSPIVLCCAHGESARLEGLVAVLRDRGGNVELLEGAEIEPRVLATVIDRHRGGGLYVLCRGGAFDREKIDAVREILLAHRIPFGRTLTLPALDQSELLERIEQSLRRMVAHAPVSLDQPKPSRTESPAQASARQRRATVMVTPPSQAPPPPPRNPTPIPAPPPARAASERPAPPKPPPARQSPAPPPPRRAVRASERATVELPAQESFAPASSTPTEPARERSEAEIASAETRADSRPDAIMPRQDTAAGAIEIDAEHVVEDPSIRAIAPPSFDEDVEIDTKVDLTGVLAGIGDNTAVAPAPEPEPVRGATQVAEAIPFEGYREDDIEIGDVTQVAPAPTVVSSIPSATTVRSPTVQRTVVAAAVEEAPSRLRFGVAAVVGSLAIGILAAVIVSSGDDDDDDDVKTAAAIKTPDSKPETKAADTKVEGTKAEDTKAEDTKAEDTKAEATEAEDTKAEATKAEATKAEDTKAEATKLAAVVPKPTDAVAKAPPARPRPPRKVEVVPPPKTRVQKALRERSIRALDVLLVTRRAAGPMDQKAAVAHCDGLELAGLDEWRLPEIGELASLTDAGFLGRGFFWSATAADTFGDSRMAWNGARRQANWRGKTSAVVCVRGHGGV